MPDAVVAKNVRGRCRSAGNWDRSATNYTIVRPTDICYLKVLMHSFQRGARPLRMWLGIVLLLGAATQGSAQKTEGKWDVTIPRGHTRTIDFTTSEGTWMSMDISPDGKWVVFDLLAHVYRVSVTGGKAECLTQDSGIALNMQPRYSPDGRSIAFISDRNGQNNLWIMDADGKNPRPVSTDDNVRVWEPAWTPDSQYILVRRQDMSDMNDYGATIWIYHRDGGEGIQLLGKDAHAFWPSVPADGKHVYFYTALCLGFPIDPVIDPMRGCFQLRQVDLHNGEIFDITSGRAMQQIRGSSGGPVAPEVSPDGHWLAFARRIPDGTISFKGHRFGPRNALWLRDLYSGTERLIMDPIETDIAEQFPIPPRVLPGYSWAHDSKSIVLEQGGKIRRLWVDSGKVETIPFTANVHRVISEMAYAPFRISDGPIEVRFLRWHTSTPNDHQLLFQAVGKIWIVNPGTRVPRRLTPDSFSPPEFSPTWSPDGQWIAFTTWDDERRGQLWKVAVSGGTPERLTQEAGEYLNPSWTQDGGAVIVTRGAGVTGHGRSLVANPWYEFVRVPATGGPAESIVRLQAPKTRITPRASLGPDGRIFYLEIKSDSSEGSGGPAGQLISVRPDGSDKRVHAKLPDAEEVAISPDGRWVAF